MDQTPAVQPTYDFKSAKKQFSRIGLALVAFFAASYAVICCIDIFVVFVFKIESYPEWAIVLRSAIGMYCVGAPVFRLCLRGTKAAAPTRGKVSLGTMCILFFISYAMTYIGNIAGNLAALLFEKATGLSITSTATELTPALPWYVTLLCVVLIGPFFEELIFRKMILDRTRVYGEKTSIFFSALLFAFFHMNLQQFFYAFLVGLVFGYLYLRTGKLSACWMLHAAFNFFGGLLPGVLLQYTNYDALLEITTYEDFMQFMLQNMPAYMLWMLYAMTVLAFVIAGFALLGVYKKRLYFAKAEQTLPPDSEASTTLVNVGVILFVALCVIFPIVEAALVKFISI